MFSTRETSFIFWLIIVIIYCLANAKIRKSLFRLLCAAFKKPLIISFSILLIYFIIVMFTIHQHYTLAPTQIKDAIIWFVTAGTITAYKGIEIAKRPHVFREIITDNIKLIVVFEFLASFYTFNLLIELIILPFVFSLFMLIEICKTQKEYRTALNFFNVIQIAFGLMVIIHVVQKSIINYRELMSFNTLISFFLPIFLTILFLPIVYLFALFSVYSDIFFRYKIHNKQGLSYWRKIKIICASPFSTRILAGLSRYLTPNLSNIHNYEELTNKITAYNHMVKKNKHIVKHAKQVSNTKNATRMDDA